MRRAARLPSQPRLLQWLEMATTRSTARATTAVAPPAAAKLNGRRAILFPHIRSLVVVCLVAGLISGFFLAIYVVKRMPIGWDTARYLDQTNLVATHGIAGTADLVLPRPKKLLESRSGFPVMVLTLSSLTHASTFQFATVVPVAAVAATALAAGAFVSYSLRRGVWELAAVALVVGTSTSLVRLMGGTYTDNLLAEALFAAALVPLLSVVREGRGFIATILLLTVGAFAHPAFYAFILAVLGLVAMAYLPSSWRSWHRGEAELLATPTARMAMVLAGSAGATAVGIFGVLRSAPDTPALSRQEFALKLREDLPLYRLPVTAPIAAVGLAALVGDAVGPAQARRVAGDAPGHPAERPDPGTVRFVLALVLAWVGVALVGILGFYAGKKWPAHRFLAFLLPLPVLIALAILSSGRSIVRRGLRYLGVGLILVGVAAMVSLGYSTYRTLDRRGLEYLDVGKVQETATAAAYLDAMGIPDSAPVVFVITDIGPQPQLIVPEESHIIRSVLSGDRIPHAYFYVGTPENYLAGRPTLYDGDTRGFNRVSTRFWQSVEPIVAEKPVALLLSAFNPAYAAVAAAHPDWIVGPRVVALNGPRPSPPLAEAPFPSAPRGVLRIFLIGAGPLALLVLIGIGWALALLPRGLRPFEVLALSVPFGIASLLLAGTITDAAGIRLVGAGGALVGPVTAAIGGILGVRRLRKQGLGWFAL